MSVNFFRVQGQTTLQVRLWKLCVLFKFSAVFFTGISAAAGGGLPDNAYALFLEKLANSYKI